MQKFRVHFLLVLSLIVALLAQYVKSSCQLVTVSEEQSFTYSGCGTIEVTVTQQRCENDGNSCDSYHHGGPPTSGRKGVHVRACGPKHTSDSIVTIDQTTHPGISSCFYGKQYRVREISSCHCKTYEVVKSTTTNTIIHTL